MNAQFSLSPAMASRKLQVLAFAKEFYLRWSRPPSYGEIAGAFGITKDHARGIVRALNAQGFIRREKGARRAWQFPDIEHRVTESDAVLALRALGYVVNPDDRIVWGADPATFPPLPMLIELDHIPDVELGERAIDRDDAG